MKYEYLVFVVYHGFDVNTMLGKKLASGSWEVCTMNSEIVRDGESEYRFLLRRLNNTTNQYE